MEPLASEVIGKLLIAGQRAPTGGNANTRRFVIVDDSKKLKVIQKISPGFLGPCPLAIVICTDTTVDQSEFISSFDSGAAAENIAIAATGLGLGVGFVKSFPERPVKSILKIPSDVRLDIIVTLGKKADHAPSTPAKSPHQPVFHNTYGREYVVERGR
jgi:nitroreductase